MSENPIFQTKREVLRDVGQCIYCGATHGQLTEEHIVPYGLNGSWVLLRASCSDCSKITSGFENKVLRSSFLAPRTALNLRTRHRHKRPKEFKASLETLEETKDINLPIGSFPAFLIFPTFLPPAYLDKRPYKKGITVLGEIHTVQIGGEYGEDIADKYKAESLMIRIADEPHAFARLIAKIGYGFAVAKYGLDNIINTELVSAILGKTDDIGLWVGSAPSKQLAPYTTLHSVSLATSKVTGEIISRISLFTFYSPPEYLVYVGNVRTTPENTIKIQPNHKMKADDGDSAG